MPLELVRSDITTMSVDSVVNAANSSLVPGGGVCGAIFAAAGYEEMDRACRAIGHCDVGQAVLTRGFRLPARYVIHAVGPVWQGGGNGEAALLRQCYLSALDVARRARCESVAFPLISSGIFGYPKAEALRIAVGAIGDFLLEHEMQVYLAVFDKKALALSERLYAGVCRYIDDHYVEISGYARRLPAEHQARTRQLLEQEAVPPERAAMPLASAAPRPVPTKRSLKDLLGRLDESFSRMLLRLIDEKGMTDVEVYKRANLDRKLFSKIRREDYKPSKPTAIALAIALRLNLDETRDLLASAGYALSHSSKFDVIVEYFIQEGVYDIYQINETLFAFDQRTLGA